MWNPPTPTSPRQRQGEVDEALLDMLLSFSDFATFKQTILDYRKVAPPPPHLPKQLATALSVFAGERGTGGGANGLRFLPHTHPAQMLTDSDTPQCIITYDASPVPCCDVQLVQWACTGVTVGVVSAPHLYLLKAVRLSWSTHDKPHTLASLPSATT